jgi:hypothetical protein
MGSTLSAWQRSSRTLTTTSFDLRFWLGCARTFIVELASWRATYSDTADCYSAGHNGDATHRIGDIG